MLAEETKVLVFGEGYMVENTQLTTEQELKLLKLSPTAQQVYGLALLGTKRPEMAEKLGITRQRASQLIKYLHRIEVLPKDVLPENPNMTRARRVSPETHKGLFRRIIG